MRLEDRGHVHSFIEIEFDYPAGILRSVPTFRVPIFACGRCRPRRPQGHCATFSAPLLSSHSQDSIVLPVELIELLNQAYFLHILATDAQKVLPPGKSLVSMLLKPNTHHDEENAALKEKVEGVMFKAFWDEVVLFISLALSNSV